VGFRGGWTLPVEVCVGRTPEILEVSHSCVAVSGSVGLELLFRGKPAVVVYRVNRGGMVLCRLLKAVPFVSLVNLLAGRELYPEFVTHRCEAGAISGHVLRWLGDHAEYARLCGELAALRERVAEPGACARAAGHILGVLGNAGGATRAAA
jgi:lipid-A-disaccharide synthase